MVSNSRQMSLGVSWTANPCLSAVDLELSGPSLRVQWNSHTLTQWSETYLEQFVLPPDSSVLLDARMNSTRSRKRTKFEMAIDHVHGSGNYADCCTEVVQFDIWKLRTSIESVDEQDIICNIALDDVRVKRRDSANDGGGEKGSQTYSRVYLSLVIPGSPFSPLHQRQFSSAMKQA